LGDTEGDNDFVALLLAVASMQSPPSALSLGDRCSLLSAILNAPAKHGTQGGDRPKVEELSFLQTGPVRDSWQHANEYADLFAVTESCDNKTFVLEHSDSRERQADAGASGNSDHVAVVTLRKVAGRKGDEFTFEERLGLSIHARAPDSATRGGYAVPPIKFTGSAGRAEEDGSWIARVKKAIFAS
jgi:hypothetical protein